MVDSVVHVEVVGPDGPGLQRFYAGLFGWEYETGSVVAPAVADAGDYGFVTPAPDAGPVAGGVGTGIGSSHYAIFYVGVDDVGEALAAAERLGGTRTMGPEAKPDGSLVVGHFRDPAGNLVGVAGPR